jgi:DTW domain-containing protein YfiP
MHKTDDDNEQDGVPDIERLRAERVARNAAVLAALGVRSLSCRWCRLVSQEPQQCMSAQRRRAFARHLDL